MQRKSTTALQNVTGLPVLIRCEAGAEDGMVGRHCVRIVTTKEILSSAKNRLKPVEWRALRGYKLLLLASQSDDIRAAHKAGELLKDIAFDWSPVGPPKDPDGLLEMALVNLLADDALTSGQELGRVLTSMFGDLRLVYWTMGKRHEIERTGQSQMKPYVRSGPRLGAPVLGIFCGSFHTAVTYKLMVNGIGICPNCLNLFARKRPKQTCCSLQCRETHRVARWRDRQAAEAALKGGK